MFNRKLCFTRETTNRKSSNNRKFAHSPLGSSLKRKNAIEKEEYKVLKNQINLINNNIEDSNMVKDDVKIDGEIIVNVGHKYIGDELKNLIANNF